MTKTITIIVITVLATSLLWWIWKKPVSDKSYKDELTIKDSIIEVKTIEIDGLYKQIKIDSLEYGKEIEHINNLRKRYPNDALIDSLFQSGQRLRDGS